jgi:hypothetical protein
LYDFKDALSQVVVEYDEEIPYDQDLAIRYSPFPIHQLCPLVVARRAKGLVPKYDLHAPLLTFLTRLHKSAETMSF